MLPYTTLENDWLSNPSAPLSQGGPVDTLAVHAAARAARSRMIGESFSRLVRLWRNRREAARLGGYQTRSAQHELDRAALNLGRL